MQISEAVCILLVKFNFVFTPTNKEATWTPHCYNTAITSSFFSYRARKQQRREIINETNSNISWILQQ